MKKCFFLSFLFSFLLIFSPSLKVNAQLLNTHDINILNERSFVDEQNNEVYEFSNNKDMMSFIDSLMLNNGIRTRSSNCFPGSPGYPTCQNNPIVSSYSIFQRTYNTIERSHNLVTPLKGPGTVSIGSSYGISIQGVSVGLSSGYSVPVPAGKTGSIRIAATLKCDVYKMMYRHKNGQVSSGGLFTKKSLISSWYELVTW